MRVAISARTFRRISSIGVLGASVSLAACGDDGLAPPHGPVDPDPLLQCGELTLIDLLPGQSVILDAIESARCVRFPSGGTAREYLAVAYSASGETSPNGMSAPYQWRTRSSILQQSAAYQLLPPASHGPDSFHANLRAGERNAAQRAAARSALGSSRVISGAPPLEGERRTFNACADPVCVSVTQVPATAVYVGANVALFVDDDLPSGGLTTTEYADMARLFDEHLYALDTAAFGGESDIDSNGVVLVLVTKQVNNLCLQVGGIVSGYFYGIDLLPAEPGSNGGEVFFAVAPDPQGTLGCHVTREFVLRVLPGTLSHEFQHMISYNQHVLMRQGPPEDSWLNEALSHFAEELAGRRVPNSLCVAGDCFSQFAFGDVSNAYQYLIDTERWFAVYPVTSTGRSAERGAAWLLLRWVVDHYGASDVFTKSLLSSGQRGAANLAAATGERFDKLLGEWHLANYLDDLPGFVPLNERLRFTSWNWRTTFPVLRAQFPGQYPRALPLWPDSTDGAYDREGMLRGGSGRYLRVKLGAGGLPVDLRLTDPTTSGPVDVALEGRIAVARIR